MHRASLIGTLACALLFVAPACSSSDSSAPPATQPDAAAQDSSDASATDQLAESAPQEAGQDVVNEPKDAATEPEACVPVDSYTPTVDDVRFKALAPVPSGEQILYGNWTDDPNGLDSVFTMAPDGSGTTKLFELWRVWSIGVSNAVDRIAVSSGEPDQEKNYCINVFDSIQHTWIYDVATQSLKLLAGGNINDECHTFSSNDKALYVCRRTNFDNDMGNTPYNVGRINLATQAFEFLTKEVNPKMALHGMPSADETLLYYTFIQMPENSRTLMRMALPGGTAEVFRDKAGAMVLSPDGKKYVFSNSEDKSTLYVSNLDGTDTLKIADHRGSSARFSPDGTRVAYLSDDDAKPCSHVDIVKVDGSESSAPTRIHDCVKAGDRITELAWVVRP